MNELENNTTQWLRYLLYIQFAAFVLGLIDWLTPVDNWNTWAQRILEAGSIYCLLRLVAVGARYRKAAVLRAVQLGLMLVTAAMSALWMRYLRITSSIPDPTVFSAISGTLTTVAMVVSWVATWQLCHAHGELVPEMAKQWRVIFFLSLITALVFSVGSGIMAALRMDEQIGTELYGILMNLGQILRKLVDVLSMLYLVRTIHILEKKEE